MQRRLAVLETLPPAVAELSRLSSSIESLAYAASAARGRRSAAARRRRTAIAIAAIAMPIAVDQDVDRRAVAAVHERLVELVGGGVARG